MSYAQAASVIVELAKERALRDEANDTFIDAMLYRHMFLNKYIYRNHTAKDAKAVIATEKLSEAIIQKALAIQHHRLNINQTMLLIYAYIIAKNSINTNMRYAYSIIEKTSILDKIIYQQSQKVISESFEAYFSEYLTQGILVNTDFYIISSRYISHCDSKDDLFEAAKIAYDKLHVVQQHGILYLASYLNRRHELPYRTALSTAEIEEYNMSSIAYLAFISKAIWNNDYIVKYILEERLLDFIEFVIKYGGGDIPLYLMACASL